MSAGRLEATLWVLMFTVALLGSARWRSAEVGLGTPKATLGAGPAEPRHVARHRLTAAAKVVDGGNAFRLERAPAPIGSARATGAAMMPGIDVLTGTAPLPPQPPVTSSHPPLAVSGIVGPPWQAMLDGVPGREGAIVVRRGDIIGELRIRDVTEAAVIVVSPDTTWTLAVRKPWQ